MWQISIDGIRLVVVPDGDGEDGARTELVTASVAAAFDGGAGCDGPDGSDDDNADDD